MYIYIYLKLNFIFWSYNFFLWRYRPNLRLGLPPWNSPFHFGFLDFRQSVRLLGWVISSSLPVHKHRKTHTQTHTLNIHALGGIRTHDPGFWASEDSACLRPLGYRDRRGYKLGAWIYIIIKIEGNNRQFYRKWINQSVHLLIQSISRLSQYVSQWSNHPRRLINESIYGFTAFVDLGSFFSFLTLYTVDRTPWSGDHPVARPLPIHRATQTHNKRTQTSMPLVRFEPTIPVFERAKTVRAVAVIG
jgi:hypothetical protein